jgi:hypothetical protein
MVLKFKTLIDKSPQEVINILNGERKQGLSPKMAKAYANKLFTDRIIDSDAHGIIMGGIR